ncbi:MAG: DegT/DnrJ/EryC1/StrS family aminotransferase [Defluviitaleaceae bacterium]|nr:DegT/DnrJ/EryC1/StrS family aminotransferase [Defluviitaleaceae bacterium]
MYRIGKEETEAVGRVIEKKSLFRINDETREVLQLERELAERFGVANCLYVSSGTAALISILAALGIGPGDEVIVPSYTFIATPNAVLNVGAIPVLAEVDETLTIDPGDLRKKITDRTRAILPVHIMGFPCDMDAIMEIAALHGLYVIEDACQSIGGTYGGRCLGSIGTAGAMSFNYYKVISAGEGGAVLVNDAEVFERSLIYHDVGCSYWSYERELTYPYFVGSQFRASELMAAVMRVQLTRLDGILSDLRRVRKSLCERFSGAKEFTVAKSNDAFGDVGITVPLRFGSGAEARRFNENFKAGTIPLDVNRHVFIHWRPILDKRVTNNPHTNPYNMELNKGGKFEITADCCPQTLDNLGRTVYVTAGIDSTEAELDALAKRCLDAAK